MTYEEFDNKYNKRNYKGVVQQASVITTTGTIVFQGTIDEVDNFMDCCDIKWQNHKVLGWFCNKEQVDVTNVGKTIFDTYDFYKNFRD